MAIRGIYIWLTAAELATKRTELLAAQSALANNQSYTIGGRSITRADGSWLTSELAEVLYATKYQAGTLVRSKNTDFRS